ncbi:MAG: 4-alpha-glucanotransferase [Alphaproteobacteria bacterium]
MNPEDPLDRLAEAYDIESGYRDIWGRRREIGAETKRAILQAMGVAAESDAAVEQSLNAVVVAAAADHLSPPLLIRRAGEPILLPVTADAGCRGRLAWTFRREDGSEQSGEATLHALELVEQITLRGRTLHRHALALPLKPPPGYHRCTLLLDETVRSETEIVIAPRLGYLPDCLAQDHRLAGLTAPLYGLRSARNAGIGDFADLASLAEAAAPMGADFIGINPVHALFPTEPDRISPYSPSSRLFSNTLLIALDRVPELDHAEKARRLLESADGLATLDRLRASDLVDYPAVAAFKQGVLEALFEAFRNLPPSSPRRVAFEAFRQAGGNALERQATFDALAAFFVTSDPVKTDWRCWPAGYRSPEAPDVQAFAAKHAERVTFHAYLQWLADEELGQAQARAKACGMALGLYLDLAVGVAPDGAEAWSHQDVLVESVRVGAPPDDFNPNGQNWGLLPLSPAGLKTRRYRPFIELMRRNMRHAGALRIDHVLGLARSFWLPAGDAVPGTYVRYPLTDLLALVALESSRNQCLVVGEDLGTVPETLRSALDDHGLLGCRLLYFEWDETGACRPASSYPRRCIASIGTHDLPPLRGFWEGRDIAWRARLGQYPDAAAERADREARERQKTNLLACLAAEGLLPEGIDPAHPPASLSEPLLDAFHRFLGRTPSMLKAVQYEDAFGAVEQANLPGTIDEHPNWRRKVGPPIENLRQADRLSTLLELAAGRESAGAER